MSFTISQGSGTQVTFHVRYEGAGVPTDLHIYLLDPKNPSIDHATALVGYDTIPPGLNPKAGFDIPFSTNPPAFPLTGGKLASGVYTFALTWSFDVETRPNETDPDHPILIQPPLQAYTPLAPQNPQPAPAPGQTPGPPVPTGPGTLHDPKTLGPPRVIGDQCWEYTMQDPSISENETLYISGTGVPDCVELYTASAVRGAATFVVCCKKEGGKCKKCNAYITLVAQNPLTKEKITAPAIVKCLPGT
jgi:hypothetical protein